MCADVQVHHIANIVLFLQVLIIISTKNTTRHMDTLTGTLYSEGFSSGSCTKSVVHQNVTSLIKQQGWKFTTCTKFC